MDILTQQVRDIHVPRKELSALTGISYNTISHWLNGFSNLTPINRDKMVDAISVFTGKMDRKAYTKKYNCIKNIVN